MPSRQGTTCAEESGLIFGEADYGKAENHETDEKDEEGQQTCD